jgi:hypothetical protein
VRQAREEWKAHRQPRMRENSHRLVFLDETGTTTKMTRLRGRARRGTRLKADAPFGHWATQTFVAALRLVLFLPPYSPDLNPIEMALAKPAPSEAEGPKAHLRRRSSSETFPACLEQNKLTNAQHDKLTITQHEKRIIVQRQERAKSRWPRHSRS